MIEIKDKKDCTGCNACVQRCPSQCIAMTADEEGFSYPTVDAARCIECGLCEKVCPVLQQAAPRLPIAVLAAKNVDSEVQLRSSSGGIFTALAKRVIENGGVVFGAKFDKNWDVVHDYTLSVDGLREFQTSKYVQSRIGSTFLQAEKFLKEGKTVMFTGTPCQLSALRLFLRKDYDNLIGVDMVCHGVPSPLVWSKYLDHVANAAGVSRRDISAVNFRDKRIGWNKFGLVVYARDNRQLLFEPYFDNLYIKVFLKGLDLRPSCYSCPSKSGKSLSDLTLADFWGIRRSHPDMYDRQGVSLLLVHSAKAARLLGSLAIESCPATYSEALAGNPSIERSVAMPDEAGPMWRSFLSNGIAGLTRFVTD